MLPLPPTPQHHPTPRVCTPPPPPHTHALRPPPALFVILTLAIYTKIFPKAFAVHGPGWALAVFSSIWILGSAAFYGVCLVVIKGFGDDGYASF